MAKALYNHWTKTNDADSSGTGVHANLPEAKTLGERDKMMNRESRAWRTMLDKHGLDMGDSARLQLTPEHLKEYDLVVNIAERGQTPDWLRGENVIWWDIKDPGWFDGMDPVIESLDQIEKRVKQLIKVLENKQDTRVLDDDIDKPTEEQKKGKE
jgi:protein-tyrosine-phosphatase